jgi:hypothetical protein
MEKCPVLTLSGSLNWCYQKQVWKLVPEKKNVQEKSVGDKEKALFTGRNQGREMVKASRYRIRIMREKDGLQRGKLFIYFQGIGRDLPRTQVLLLLTSFMVLCFQSC